MAPGTQPSSLPQSLPQSLQQSTSKSPSSLAQRRSAYSNAKGISRAEHAGNDSRSAAPSAGCPAGVGAGSVHVGAAVAANAELGPVTGACAERDATRPGVRPRPCAASRAGRDARPRSEAAEAPEHRDAGAAPCTRAPPSRWRRLCAGTAEPPTPSRFHVPKLGTGPCLRTSWKAHMRRTWFTQDATRRMMPRANHRHARCKRRPCRRRVRNARRPKHVLQ